MLEGKIKLWNNSMIGNFKKIENQHKLLIDKINQKRAVQIKNLNLLKIEQEVIPQSISLAYLEMGKKYSGVKGLELLRELIDKIES